MLLGIKTLTLFKLFNQCAEWSWSKMEIHRIVSEIRALQISPIQVYFVICSSGVVCELPTGSWWVTHCAVQMVFLLTLLFNASIILLIHHHHHWHHINLVLTLRCQWWQLLCWLPQSFPNYLLLPHHWIQELLTQVSLMHFGPNIPNLSL